MGENVRSNLRCRGVSAAITFLLCFTSTLSLARDLIDQTGQKVSVSDHPNRIVALAPSLGELVAEFLDEPLSRLVGVSEFTDYPPVLKKLKRVGSYAKFNLEQVVALRPDLVLATSDGNAKDQVLRLRELGFSVVVVSTRTLKEVAESFVLVGKALGMEKEGLDKADQFRRGMERIRERGKSRDRTKVLLQIGEEPLVVIGKGSFVHEALELTGAQNLFEDSSNHYPRPSLEAVLARKPETILVLAQTQDRAFFQKMALNWKRFPHVPAVKKNHVQVLWNDSLIRPTLRLLEGISELEKAIYGTK